MSRPQTTDFDRKNPRTGAREDAPHLRTFANEQEAGAANGRALEAMRDIARAEGLRVVAFVTAEHRCGGDVTQATGELISANGGDLIRAHERLGRNPTVISHGFARLFESLFEQNKKG